MLIQSQGKDVAVLRKLVYGSATRFGGFGLTGTIADQEVTRVTAMSLPAMYAGAMLIAKMAGTLRLGFNDRQTNAAVSGGEKDLRLNVQTSMDTPASVFWSSMFLDLGLTHNAYAVKLPPSDGIEAPELLWTPSDFVRVWRDETGMKRYDMQSPNGGAAVTGVAACHVLHVSGPRIRNTNTGASPIELTRESLGAGRSTMLRRGRGTANNGVPPGILTSPDPLTREEAAEIREMWQDRYAGVNDEGEIGVLGRGATFEAIKPTNRDDQYIEQLKFAATEAARTLNMMPQMIGADGNALTYDNADSNNASFLRYTIRPHLVYSESALAIDKDFFGARAPVYPKWDTSEIMRMTQAEAFTMLSQAVHFGFLDAATAQAIAKQMGVLT